jgi:hypothetical protein
MGKILTIPTWSPEAETFLAYGGRELAAYELLLGEELDCLNRIKASPLGQLPDFDLDSAWQDYLLQQRRAFRLMLVQANASLLHSEHVPLVIVAEFLAGD